ncbi:hypothetical protein [Cytobacillus oceanisediminis]|uniref:hypothetical protein n=1 Tax=Cytobacillus oceanisediminis TaxID=665099 RepID=UPI001FB36526|nr:hypothetical protein [Cytobacillus oceanisediminis]UOE58093.1 hypothetical protein IRB79_26625 [Cytobacillus oceanisediminis]
MAQFPNVNRNLTFKGKTHTNLVVSEGAAPAEDMIISRTNDAETFVYEYGPEGNQTVVLAKGKIAEIVGAEYDADTGFHKTAVRQAKDGSEKVAGVNLHNVYSRRRDGMHSHLTKPSLFTRNYIEVPLFETIGALAGDGTTPSLEAAQVLAEAMKFGAAVSETGDAKLQIQHGDYVVSDRSGNFRKYAKGTDAPEAIVGQVWAKETQLPPAGFLQYYTDLVNPEMEEFIKLMSRTPSPGLPADGTAAAFPYGAPHTIKGWKPEFEKMLMGAKMAGIPFLTDGFFRAQETRNFAVASAGAKDANVEAVRAGEGTTFDAAANKLVVAAGTRNAAVFIKLKHKIDQTKLANLVAQLNGKAVNANDLHVDVVNNTVVIYLPENESADAVEHTGLTLTVPMVVDPVAGIPTGWDYKGSVGAIRILLQK